MNTKQNLKPDSERLQVIIDSLHISANKLAKLLNYKSPASIYHVLDGINSISGGMAERMVKKFPQVNYLYLRTGEGKPILDSKAEKQAQENLFGSIIDGDDNLENSEGDYKENSLMQEIVMLNQQMKSLVDSSERTNKLLQELINIQTGKME